MPATMPLPHLRPISDLRTDLNGICKEARESRSPIFLPKNGTATLVVMDCDAYERQRQHERYVLKLREAEIEARYHPESVSQASLDEHIADVLATLKEHSRA